MQPQTRTAALGTLIILQSVMFAALLFKLPPHPPEVIPIGGMAPTLGASLCAAFAALVMRDGGAAEKVLIIAACLLAAISYGPQKYFDPAFSLVWPAVVTAQLAIAVLLTSLVQERLRKHGESMTSPT